MATKQRDTSNDVAMTPRELKAWMNRHGMNVHQLAEMLGLTGQAVIYWLQGARAIPEPVGRLFNLFDRKPDLMREF